jgi:hypothetical protein
MQSLNPQFIADDVTDRRLRHRYTRRVGWASVRQNSTLCFPAGHAATNVLAEPHAGEAQLADPLLTARGAPVAITVDCCHATHLSLQSDDGWNVQPDHPDHKSHM